MPKYFAIYTTIHPSIDITIHNFMANIFFFFLLKNKNGKKFHAFILRWKNATESGYVLQYVLLYIIINYR